MSTTLGALEQVFAWLLTASWQASVLALLVLALQGALGSRLNPRWRYALWLLVLARLLLPFQIESALSLFQFAPAPPPELAAPITQPIFEPPAAPQNLTASAPLAAPTHPLSLFSLLALAWLAGVFVLGLLTFEINRRFARHVAAAPEVTDRDILDLFASARAEIPTRAQIRLVESARVGSPAIMGLFRPTLLLPARVRETFDPAELRLIFLHELAHLRRGDIFVQGLIALLQILHWFNPLLWFAFRRMRADREPAADALVLSRAGEEEKERYGLVLLKLLEHFHQRHSLPTLVGILEDQDRLKRRITLIARFTRGAYGWSLLGVFCLCALSALCLTAKSAPAKNSDQVATSSGGKAAAKGIGKAESDLQSAVSGDHLDLAKALLEEGIDPSPDQPLFIYAHSAAMVQFLRRHGASFQPKLDDRETLIEYVASNGSDDDAAVIDELIKEGAPFDPKGSGVSALARAAARNQVATMQVLLNHGVDPNAYADDPRMQTSPLRNAAGEPSPDAVKFLLAHGANPAGSPRDDFTPLAMAIYQQRAQNEALLRQAGAHDVSELASAAAFGNTAKVLALLQSGADVNRGDSMDRSPLAYAVRNGQVETAKLLVDHGAKINAPDSTGLSPAEELEFTADFFKENPGLDQVNWNVPSDEAQRRIARLRQLFARDPAGPNDRDSQGRTVLHRMAFAENPMIMFFAGNKEHPSDPNIRDNDGNTPLLLAVISPRAKDLSATITLIDAKNPGQTKAWNMPAHIADTLIRAGARLDLVVRNGKTVGELAMQAAIAAKNAELISVLREAGAPASEKSTETTSTNLAPGVTVALPPAATHPSSTPTGASSVPFLSTPETDGPSVSGKKPAVKIHITLIELNQKDYDRQAPGMDEAVRTGNLSFFRNRITRATDLILVAGQNGWYNEGEVSAYVASAKREKKDGQLHTVLSSKAVFFGLNADFFWSKDHSSMTSTWSVTAPVGFDPLPLGSDIPRNDIPQPLLVPRVMISNYKDNAWDMAPEKAHGFWLGDAVGYVKLLATGGSIKEKISHESPSRLAVFLTAQPFAASDTKTTDTKAASEKSVETTSSTVPGAGSSQSASIQGTVIDPDGKPAAGAKIGVGGTQPLNVWVGRFSEMPDSLNPGLTPCSADGKFSIIGVAGTKTIFAMDASGYALVPIGTFNGKIALKPWASVEGKALIGPTPANRSQVIFHSYPPAYISGNGITISAAADTDEKGAFALAQVPEGIGVLMLNQTPLIDLSTGKPVTFDKTRGPPLPVECQHIQSVSGQTTRTILGGPGVTVTGKLPVLPKVKFFRLLTEFWSRSPVHDPALPAFVQSDQEKQQFMRELQASDLAKKDVLGSTGYYFYIQRDGSFRVENVPPGTYSLSVDTPLMPGKKLVDISFEVPSGVTTYEIPASVFETNQTPPGTTSVVPSKPIPKPAPTSVDNDIQQHIDHEMVDLTDRLKLTPQQQAAVKAAMEAVVSHTATKSVNQVIHEIGSPRQLAAWEQIINADRAQRATESASFESKRIATLLGLASAKQNDIFLALCPVELQNITARESARSAADYFALDSLQLRESDTALAKVLTTAQIATLRSDRERQAAAAAVNLTAPILFQAMDFNSTIYSRPAQANLPAFSLTGR